MGVLIARYLFEVNSEGRSTGAHPVFLTEAELFGCTHMPVGKLAASDCIWMVPTWVPPTPEPEE